MKKYTAVLTALVLASSMAFAQETPTAAIQLDGMNILYSGVDNPITVAASGHKAEDLTLVMEEGEGTITKGSGEGEYLVRPKGGQKRIVLQLRSGGQMLASNKYRVKPMPIPELILSGLRSGDSIRREDVKAGTPVVVMKNPEFLLKVDPNSMRITNMIVACGRKEETVRSNKLSDAVESIVSTAEKGSKLIILAEVVMPDGDIEHVTAIYPLKGYPEGGPVIYQPVVTADGDPEVDDKGFFIENAFISMEGLEYYAPHMLIDGNPNGSLISRKDITADSYCILEWNIEEYRVEMGATVPPQHDFNFKGDCATVLGIKTIVGPKEVDLGWRGEFNEEAVKMIHRATRGDRLIIVAHVLINGTTEMDLYTFYTLK